MNNLSWALVIIIAADISGHGRLDVCPTGDQEVAGSTPASSATFFRGDLIMKYFLWSFSPLPLIQEGQLSVSGKRMCTILVNRLED